MKNISKGEGKTVLFVSHNMASVKSLCTRGIILENGSVKIEGDTDVVISTYLKGDSGLINYKVGKYSPLISINEIEIFEIGVKAKDKKNEDIITLNDEILFFIKYKQKTSLKNIHITLHIKDELGNVVFTSGSSFVEANNKTGVFDVGVEFPDNFFNWGSFFIDLYIVENKKRAIYIEKDILSFTIINKQKELGTYMGKEPGAIHPKFNWYKKALIN